MKNKYLCGLAIFVAIGVANADSVNRNFASKLNQAALERTQSLVIYNGKYIKIPYPNGDVPKNIGVCTDVVIRSYRKLGIDLQQLVHEDMKRHFSAYPSKRLWGLKYPDSNIDHRRVPNLQAFFKRKGKTLPITHNGNDYKVGDLVTYMLSGNLPHIAIVTDKIGKSGNPKIVHNIGLGPKLDDSLFDYTITGHYRYLPK